MKELFIACNLDAGEITNQRLGDFHLKLGEIVQSRSIMNDNFGERGNVDINLLNSVIQIKITTQDDIEFKPGSLINAILEALESVYITQVFGVNFSYNEDIETSFNVFDTDIQNRFRNVEEDTIGAGIKYAVTKNDYNFDIIYEPNYAEYKKGKYNQYYFQANSGFDTENISRKDIVKKIDEIYNIALTLEETAKIIFQRVDNNDDNISF